MQPRKEGFSKYHMSSWPVRPLLSLTAFKDVGVTCKWRIQMPEFSQPKGVMTFSSILNFWGETGEGAPSCKIQRHLSVKLQEMGKRGAWNQINAPTKTGILRRVTRWQARASPALSNKDPCQNTSKSNTQGHPETRKFNLEFFTTRNPFTVCCRGESARRSEYISPQPLAGSQVWISCAEKNLPKRDDLGAPTVVLVEQIISEAISCRFACFPRRTLSVNPREWSQHRAAPPLQRCQTGENVRAHMCEEVFFN